MTQQRKIWKYFVYPFLLILFFVFLGISWWWIDSYQTCSEQDEYSLRGICLMQVVDQAKDGQVGPQWAYADYLRINNKQAAAEEWYQTAMKNSKTGKDLWGHFIGRCDKTNLFNHKAIEAKLKAVAKTSPDTNLLLLDFYLLLDCGAFDLAKATETLPKLTQCAHLALGEYIRMADRMKYPIKEKAFIDIKNNIKLCHNELKNGPADDSLVKEFIPLRQESLDELERMVAKTITN